MLSEYKVFLQRAVAENTLLLCRLGVAIFNGRSLYRNCIVGHAVRFGESGQYRLDAFSGWLRYGDPNEIRRPIRFPRHLAECRFRTGPDLPAPCLSAHNLPSANQDTRDCCAIG